MDEKPFRPALPTEPPPAEYDPMRLPFTLPLVPVPPLHRKVGEEHMTDTDLRRWHANLGDTWRDVQTLLFRAGLSDSERAAIETALARITSIRDEMAAALRTP